MSTTEEGKVLKMKSALKWFACFMPINHYTNAQ